MRADVRVMISSPLEADLVERVRAVPCVADVFYDPALLPPVRYPCDHGGDPAFRRDAAGQARWDAALGRAHVLIGYPNESSAELARALAAGPHVEFVQGTSAGMGAHVARAALSPQTLARVRFASAAGVHGGMLAEFFFHGLLSLRKDAARLARIRRERVWEHYVMGELDGSTLVVVGLGQIAAALARRARAFGMHLVGVNRDGAAAEGFDETYAMSRLREALARADAVAVTLPATVKTAGLIDRAALEALRPHAVFGNVGRGSVVDEAALIERLAAGSLAGAVLDVFASEPLAPESPLWTLPNVVLSPHTAAVSLRENARIVAIFCENIERFARGDRLRNQLDLVEYY